jgi:glycosyltransferase involved in cell wall biosynthesis
MNIVCLIDHLGTGGAQRQMSYLASGLRHRGHKVTCAVKFEEFDSFRPYIEAEGVNVAVFGRQRRLHRCVWSVRSILRAADADAVVSFLTGPNVYAELARLLMPRLALIVSERSSHHADRGLFRAFGLRALHGLADYVVANSVSHAEWLARRHYWLKRRCRTIYNAVDLEAFPEAPELIPTKRNLNLLGVGRVGPEKNVLTLIRALQRFASRHGWSPVVRWAGRRAVETSLGSLYNREVDAALAAWTDSSLYWQWLGVRSDIAMLLASHHALIHPSLYEGLPNAICEALAVGRPVLASDVCDNGILIGQKRGWMFDPGSEASILRALEQAACTPPDRWRTMSRAAGVYAADAFAIGRMVDEFEHLIEDAVRWKVQDVRLGR